MAIIEMQFNNTEEQEERSIKANAIVENFRSSKGLKTYELYVDNIKAAYVYGWISKNSLKGLYGLATQNERKLKLRFPEFFTWKKMVVASADKEFNSSVVKRLKQK